MPFGILEDAENHIRQNRPRSNHLAAEHHRLLERCRDVWRLRVERHPRSRTWKRLTDPAGNAPLGTRLRQAVVDRWDDVERPPEQVAVELLKLAAVRSEEHTS